MKVGMFPLNPTFWERLRSHVYDVNFLQHQAGLVHVVLTLLCVSLDDRIRKKRRRRRSHNLPVYDVVPQLVDHGKSCLYLSMGAYRTLLNYCENDIDPRRLIGNEHGTDSRDFFFSQHYSCPLLKTHVFTIHEFSCRCCHHCSLLHIFYVAPKRRIKRTKLLEEKRVE